MELDYSSVLGVISSSELNVTSELEVLNAVIKWLNYNIRKRKRFAKSLLQKVRVPLLSVDALKHMLSKPSEICKIDECVDMLKKALKERGTISRRYYQCKSSIHYTHRYCSNPNFNILICGGRSSTSYQITQRAVELNVNNPAVTIMLPSMKNPRYHFKTVCLKGEVYLFGGHGIRGTWVRSVDKYSPVTKKWNKVSDMFDDRTEFCACAFMGKVFIFGGRYHSTATNTCFQFNTKDKGWKEVAAMNETRQRAACAAFEGKIVICGGWDTNVNKLNTVQSFDVIANLWKTMPNMVERRSDHNLLAVKRKLFSIGGNNRGDVLFNECEVFDSTCNRFVTLKSSALFYAKAVSIGSKVFIFQNKTSNLVIYDTHKEEWSEEPCEATNNYSNYSCVKLPAY